MRTMFLAFVVLATAAPSARGRAQVIDLAKVRTVDLTHPYNAKTLYWPTAPSGFKLQQLAYGPTPGGWFYSSNSFAAPEHGGTHLDAPIHFSKTGRTADQIPVEQLIASAVVIDIRNKTKGSHGADAARYLVKERRVGALGADVASIDYGQTKDFIVHQIVAEGQVAGLENLTNLHLLPPTGAVAIALPMKIEGGSGGPLRAVALIPR